MRIWVINVFFKEHIYKLCVANITNKKGYNINVRQ